MKNYIIIILFGVLCTSIVFSQKQEEPLRVPLHQSKGVNVEDLFLNIKYTPLENKKDAIIQEVEDFWATGEDIIVFDRRGKAILFFNQNGTFKHKIDKVPNCPPCNRAETLFSSVFVNKEKKHIYAIYGTSMENVTMGIFDFNGNFLGEKKEWYVLDGMGFIGNSILMANYFFSENKIENIQFLHKDKITTISLFDPKFKTDYSSLPNRISKNSYNGKLYWSEPYENIIYSIDSNTNISSMELIFPIQYSLSKDFVKKNLGKIDNIIKTTYPNAIIGITNIMKIKEFMILNLMSHIALDGVSSILLNSETGEAYDLNQIKPSIFNNYMPISSSKNQSFFLDSNKEKLYSLIYPEDLIEHYSEAEMIKQINQAPSYISDIVKKREIFRNPIVVISSMR